MMDFNIEDEKQKNVVNNKSLFKLYTKYFIFQLIPICIIIFIQFYSFRIISIDRQIETTRRIIKTSIISQYTDLLKIKDDNNLININNEIIKTEQKLSLDFQFETSKNEFNIENVINKINKNNQEDEYLLNYISKYFNIEQNNIAFYFNSSENKIEVISIYNDKKYLYTIHNIFEISDFNVNIEYSDEQVKNLKIQFFEKQFQIDVSKLFGIDGYYLFTMRYEISNSISFHVYLSIIIFFFLFWQFSGQYFGIKRLVQNDSQLLNSFIEVSMDSNMYILDSQEKLQFPELFDLAKKINGVSSIYSKLYNEMSRNKLEIQSMINNIPEQIFKIDKDFNILNSNNVQSQMTEYFHYELYNNKLYDFLQDDESKNTLFTWIYRTFIERKTYYEDEKKSNRNEKILNKIGQLHYQHYNLVERITNEKQYKYQSFDITGIDLKLKTKSGKTIQTKCSISCINDNEFIVSVNDISHELIQQEKINTLYNLQIDLIKNNVDLNHLLKEFQYIIKQDSQYLLKINENSVDVEYGVVTDNKNRILIDHQETLDYGKLQDIKEILDKSGELLINNVDQLDNQYLKQWLTKMNIKTCILFKIENTEYNILYAFGIDFIKYQLTEHEIKEVLDLYKLFKNIIENYIIRKEYMKISEKINQKNIQILDNIFDFIYQIDENDKIIFVNDKTQKALNKNKSDLLFRDYIEQFEINEFYQDKIRFDNRSIMENKMSIIEDSGFLLGNFQFRGSLLRKYAEIMGKPQMVCNFKQHQDISNIESMNKLINRKILFVDDIMLKVNNKGFILKYFIPFGQNYELIKMIKDSNSKNIMDIIDDNIKNKEVQISLNSKIDEILNTDVLQDSKKTVSFEEDFNINDIEHIKLRFNFNRQTDNNLNIIIQTKI